MPKGKGGTLKMPLKDFKEIRTTDKYGVLSAIDAETAEIADEADELAGTTDGYDTDLNVGTDRARGHVWAKTGEAIHAENKSSPLMQIAARKGAG